MVLSLAAIQAALSVLAVLASQGGSALLVISASLYVLVASLAIIALDTQRIEEFGVEGRTIGSRALSKRAVAALGVLGLGAGLSPFFFAYYDATKWVPIGLAITLVCAVAIVIRPRRPGGPAALTLVGLLGLGVFSLLSTAWSESVENAVVSGNRWLAYGALTLLLLALVSHERRAAVLLVAAGLGIAAVAISVLARLLGSDPGSLFLNGRLNAPLTVPESMEALAPYGRDAMSIVFFSTPGTERLYSGVTNSSPSHASTACLSRRHTGG